MLKCRSCPWWDEFRGGAKVLPIHLTNKGYCRVEPPKLYLSGGVPQSAWPIVDGNSWCAYHGSRDARRRAARIGGPEVPEGDGGSI